MWTHPGDAALMDVVEGSASERVRGHVAGCAQCRQRTDDVRATLGWTQQAAVPEPAPAYWDVLRRRVALGIDQAPAPRRSGRLWTAAGLAAAAVVAVITVVPASRVPAPPTSVAPAAVLPAWSALPAAEDDAGLAILEHAAPTAVAAAPALECADVAECVASLSDDESRALADALRAQLRPGDRL